MLFSCKDANIVLEKLWRFCDLDSGFVQVQIAGENKDTHMGAKMMRSSEAGRFTAGTHNFYCRRRI